MKELSDPCPGCGYANKPLAHYCQSCGEALVATPPQDPSSSASGYAVPAGLAAVRSAWPGKVVMGVFTAAALILLVFPFVSSALQSAIQEAAIFAASAASGVIARLGQASVHHAETLNELRRR